MGAVKYLHKTTVCRVLRETSQAAGAANHTVQFDCDIGFCLCPATDVAKQLVS